MDITHCLEDPLRAPTPTNWLAFSDPHVTRLRGLVGCLSLDPVAVIREPRALVATGSYSRMGTNYSVERKLPPEVTALEDRKRSYEVIDTPLDQSDPLTSRINPFTDAYLEVDLEPAPQESMGAS